MKESKAFKLISLALSFLLIFQQSGFAQAAAQLDLAGHLAQMHKAMVVDKFRPLHLRFFSYDTQNDHFEMFLDKSGVKDIKEAKLREEGKELLKYFLIGISLPNESFWVNLRPDSPDKIIDPQLARTDIGKILLEADVQLKQDTALATSPDRPEGREYWNKLYAKAGELFGSENITIPTLTRPWIVPGEVIIRQTEGSVYVYKATLKVMLEEDYLKDRPTVPNNSETVSALNWKQFRFSDQRLKELNTYSTQLIKELIIPKLTQEVNSSKRYAALRQVFYSLILARWFKQSFAGKSGLYPQMINRGDLTDLTSQTPWSKDTYFKQYQKSFKDGAYNFSESVYTPFSAAGGSAFGGGQVIRSYFSGGINWAGSSPIVSGGLSGASSAVEGALGADQNTVSLSARPTSRKIAPMPVPSRASSSVDPVSSGARALQKLRDSRQITVPVYRWLSGTEGEPVGAPIRQVEHFLNIGTITYDAEKDIWWFNEDSGGILRKGPDTSSPVTEKELIAKLENGDAVDRRISASALGRKAYSGQQLSPSAISALAKRLYDKEISVASNAEWALGEVIETSPQSALSPLLEVLLQPLMDEWWWRGREKAAWLLASIASRSGVLETEGIKKLISGLRQVLLEERELNLVDTPVVEALRRLLDNPEINWRELVKQDPEIKKIIGELANKRIDRITWDNAIIQHAFGRILNEIEQGSGGRPGASSPMEV